MTSNRPEPDVEVSDWIARPPEELWNYLADVAHETQWRQGVTDARWISSPPRGVGSTGLHVIEGMGDWPWRVTEWEAPHNISWDVTGGRFAGAHAGYRLAPEATGSRMTLHVRAQQSLLWRIFMLIMKRRMRRDLAADLAKLKAIMEA